MTDLIPEHDTPQTRRTIDLLSKYNLIARVVIGDYNSDQKSFIVSEKQTLVSLLNESGNAQMTLPLALNNICAVRYVGAHSAAYADSNHTLYVRPDTRSAKGFYSIFRWNGSSELEADLTIDDNVRVIGGQYDIPARSMYEGHWMDGDIMRLPDIYTFGSIMTRSLVIPNRG